MTDEPLRARPVPGNSVSDGPPSVVAQHGPASERIERWGPLRWADVGRESPRSARCAGICGWDLPYRPGEMPTVLRERVSIRSGARAPSLLDHRIAEVRRAARGRVVGNEAGPATL